MYCLLILRAEGNGGKSKQLNSLTGKMTELSVSECVSPPEVTCACGMSDWLTVAGGLSEFWCYTKGKEKQS